MNNGTTWVKTYLDAYIAHPATIAVRALPPLSVTNETGDRGRSQQLTLRQAIDQSPRLLVVGAAGAGKSCSLRLQAMTMANVVLNEQRTTKQKNTPLVPIYVDLAQFRDSIEQTISESVGVSAPVWRELSDRSLVFFIDGLEQLRSDIQLTALSSIATLMSTLGTQARWVLTCRSEALPLFRPWFSTADVRALRPLPPRDVVAYVRTQCGDAAALLLEGDDAAVVLAGRPRWLGAYIQLMSREQAPPVQLRGKLLWEWMQGVVTLTDATAHDVLARLLRIRSDMGGQRDPWVLADVVQRALPGVVNTALVAQQLLGAPTTDPIIGSLRALVGAGVLLFDYEQQTLTFRHNLLRAAVSATQLLTQPVASWSLASLTEDDEIVGFMFAMSENRPAVVRRCIELGLVRAVVRALLHHDATRVDEVLHAAGVHTPVLRLAVADVLQQEGAYRQARQQLELVSAMQPQDTDVLRRIADLSTMLHDWPGAVKSYEVISKTRPEDLHSRHQLGVAYGQLGSLDAAAHVLRGLFDTYRQQGANVARALGQIYIQQKNYPAALEAFDLALRDVTDDPLLYRQKAQVLEHLDRASDAQHLLVHAVAQLGNQPALLAELGRLCWLRGELQAAQNYLDKALRLAPDDAASHATLGRVYLSLSDWHAAWSALQRAIELHPNDDTLYVDFARVCDASGDSDAAIVALRTAIELAPTNVVGQRHLVQLLQRRGDTDGALQIVRAALVQSANHAALHGDLAGLLWRRGDHDTALATYRNAVTLAPDDTTYMHAMAQSLSELGRQREAVEIYNKALGIDGDNIALLRDAVVAYEKLGHFEQGDAVLQRALLHHADNAELLRTAAGFALRRGQIKRARSYIAKALWHTPDDQSWFQAGLLHIAEGDWKQALFALRRIIDAASNGSILEAIGRALAGDGQIDAAIQTFDQAIQLQPDNPQTLVAYSQAMAQHGRYDSAYEQARSAYQRDPGNVDALLQVGRMALATQRPNEASEMLEAAATLAPQRVDVQSERSRVLRSQGFFEQALQVAHQALGIDGHAVEAIVAAAEALFGLTRHEEAGELYRQALAIDPNHESALSGLRDVSIALDDFTQAADVAQRLVSLVPKSAMHHLRLGEVLIAIGVPEAAIIELQQALDLDRATPHAKNSHATPAIGAAVYARMSAAYAKSARWSEARECAEQAVAAAPAQAEHHALLGDAFLGMGQRTSAIASYRIAVQQRPDHAGWHYLLGMLLHHTGADKEAVQVLQEAIVLNDRAEYYHTLGRAFLGIGDSKSAVSAIEKAIAKRPEAHHWRADLADVQAQRGWHKEAINEIDQALAVAADHPVLWRKRAELLLRIDQIDAAAADVLEALRRDAHDVKALTLMSQIMQRKGNLQRALEAAERATKLNANDAYARNQLAVVLRVLKRRGEAILHMIAAVRLRDQDYEWWVELSEDYESINDFINAAHCMVRAVELVPMELNLVYRLGMLYFQSGEYAAAEHELRRVMVQLPSAAATIACLADVSLAQGKTDEALSLARRAVELQGQVSEHWRVFARVLRTIERYDEALESARTAFQLDNEYAPSALMYGILLLDFGEIEEAVSAFAAAVKADDGVAIYHLCLGMALRQQAPLAKDLEEFTQPSPPHLVKLTAAMQAFDRTLTIDGDNPRCIFERGVALQLMLRHHEAIASFDAALVLYGEVHPRPLSGDAAAASMLDKNDLAAHIRQRRALSLALLHQYEAALVDQRYVLAVAPLSVQDQYIYGRLAYLAGDLDGALSALASAATSMPGNAAVQQWYGMVLFTHGRLKEAISALELANDLLPNQGTINALLRDVYKADQRIDRAISAAQRATRYDSANPDNHYQLAKLYMETHRNSDARSAVMVAITLKNDVIAWHMLLGDVCAQMGMFDNARSAYLSATSLDPESTAPLYALSRLLVLQGRINDAITNLEQALLRDPQNGAWYFELGQLYEQRGDQSMARAAYNKAILLDGDKAEYYRAVSKMEAKQHAKTKETPPVAAATEVVKRHAHKFTNEAEMFLAMGDVNFEQKLYDTALEHYESALANDMTYAPSWCRVAQTKVKLGRVRDAQNDFQQALRHDAKCVDAYVGLATIAHNERNFGEALDFLRMAVTINPNAVAYQVDLAETLYALNQKEECQQTLRKMMKYLPSDAALLVRFAELAVKVAMTDDAFTALQRAITLDDTIARAYLLIGRIYRQKSDTPKAVAAFRRAIKLSPDFKEAQHELTFAAPLSVFNRRRDLD